MKEGERERNKRGERERYGERKSLYWITLLVSAYNKRDSGDSSSKRKKTYRKISKHFLTCDKYDQIDVGFFPCA